MLSQAAVSFGESGRSSLVVLYFDVVVVDFFPSSERACEAHLMIGGVRRYSRKDDLIPGLGWSDGRTQCYRKRQCATRTLNRGRYSENGNKFHNSHASLTDNRREYRLLRRLTTGSVYSQSGGHRISVAPEVAQQIRSREIELTGMELSKNLDANTSAVVKNAVSEAFLAGFRVVLFSCAGVAMGCAGIAWVLVKKK
jgi:hypothetical protein